MWAKRQGKFTWKQVLEAYELKNAFLFYISQSQALALAKSDATPEEQQAIRELAQEKLGKRFIIKAR